jgi:hypothetical protein
LDETGCIFRAVHSGGAGRAIAAHLKNYIFDFYNVIINYNLDIWDFFPPPLVKNPAYGPVYVGII